MDFDAFSTSSHDSEGVRYYISPAGKLALMKLTPRQREKIMSCLVNEAIAARELIKLTPDGEGGIALSPRDNITEEIATMYGQAVLDTNDAFSGTGHSYETLRD